MSFTFSSQQTIPVRVALEPVYNALNSFSLLTATEHLPGLNMWVVQTAAALSPKDRHANRLVFEGLRDAVTPAQRYLDFMAYLQGLSEQDPHVMRDRLLERLRTHYSRRVTAEGTDAAPAIERLLTDVQAYLTCVEYVQVDRPFDPQLQREVHSLLNDAPAMQALIISHLDALWKTAFAVEWRRVQPSLRWQVEMFTYNLDSEATIEETFYTLTGRKLPPTRAGQLNNAEEIILVPTWHTGRQVTLWEDETSIRLFFSEPPNYDVAQLRAAPVGQAELRARFAALADETRLRILELLVQQDEMSAQDIIAALDLSQSSVSRHLKQLVAMKYLYERRGEGANKTYRLSSFYFARTTHALEQLVSGQDTQTEAPTEHLGGTHSPKLRRFLDLNGRLTMWPPAKQRDKILILEYLASFFEPGRVYSEKEVNELLLSQSTINDAAALRRALYEFRCMNRIRDGSQYWLFGTKGPEHDVLN